MDPHESRVAFMRDLSIAFACISTIIIGLRAYTRAIVVRNWGVDDTIACLAWFSLMGLLVFVFLAVNYGAGRHIETLTSEDITKVTIIYYASAVPFFLTSALVRLSIVTFLHRVSSERWMRVAQYILGVVTTATALFYSLYVIFLCRPIRAGWDISLYGVAKCNNTQTAFLVYYILSLVIDTGLLIVPLLYVCKTMHFNMTTLKVVLIFAVGSISIIASIARVAFALDINLRALDVTWTYSWIVPWYLTEVNLGLWAASFPAIQPIIRLLVGKLHIITGWIHSITALIGVRRAPSDGIKSIEASTHV